MTDTRIPPAIRALLACPKCRGALADDDLNERLTCARCRLAYPVRDGIPVMLIDQASVFVP
jgi:uncharacterized protein YbaR (Trm112 family)